MSSVYKIPFNFKLQDAFPCSKTKTRRQIDRGLAKIEKQLDVANFIRDHLQMRQLLKQLFDLEQRKAARDLKLHLDSSQSSDSEESKHDQFETEGQASHPFQNKVKPTQTTQPVDTGHLEINQHESISFRVKSAIDLVVRNEQTRKKVGGIT